MSITPPTTGRVSLMAAGEFRDALTALERGDHVAALSALMAIDPASWHAIEQRLADLGGSLPELLTTMASKS